MTKNILPFGSWKSPITSGLITSESVTLDQVHIFDGTVYWLERRPMESGRSVIVSFRNNKTKDMLPPPFNARSRVHEYGGGVYCACKHGIFFVNDADQDIYRSRDGSNPQRITDMENVRFADLCFDSRQNRILCVCEDHSNSANEPENSLVSIDVTSGAISTLHQGYDFYSNPRINHDGSKLAWLCWNHPNMPWDGTELWLADVNENGLLAAPMHVAGSESTSIFQPEWSPEDILYYVTDESGWWNLARHDESGGLAVTTQKSEFGLPQWVFGQTTYAFNASNSVFCTHITNGIGRLSVINLDTLAITAVETPQNSFVSICADDNTVCFIAASESTFTQVIRLNADNLEPEVIASSCNTNIDDGHISTGQRFSYETRHADKAYAIYYPPVNSEYEAPEDELPPLIVLCHGGPTGMADASLDLRKQYWTSRGFAIVDVNYSGSTGYGRNYRNRLNGKWGVRDAEDVCDAANYFADKGIADKNRLIIKGSSAGGYTVLAALTFHNTFTCGASYYGISNLESLITDTHKFESRYTDRLVGGYPEHSQLYHDRSPINFVDRLSCPVIFFQGMEDRVVPPSQAEKMVAALRNKGIAVSYVSFENEQHGFRHAATIKAALDSEIYFYSVILGFNPADKLSKIPIENVDA
jgi:dipeptidyl aminopeptidase/acylaminoacyl peptidase